MKGVVHTPYYDWDGRKYMEILIEGRVTRVKVPFRYGRVMCRTEGLKTVQELQKGDEIEIEIEKKIWDGVNHWILSALKT
jgi:hypothetical protein